MSQAAQKSGLKQSALSRFLSGERPVYADHVAALMRSLPDADARERCVLAFLRDQCPPGFADRLVAHFGKHHEPALPQIGDDLDDAVAAIRRAHAAGNIYARKVVVNLARAIDPDPPDKSQRKSGGGPAVSLSRSA